jgi:succinate dehydrogenase hydrophobic anchor subunit
MYKNILKSISSVAIASITIFFFVFGLAANNSGNPPEGSQEILQNIVNFIIFVLAFLTLVMHLFHVVIVWVKPFFNNTIYENTLMFSGFFAIIVYFILGTIIVPIAFLFQ